MERDVKIKGQLRDSIETKYYRKYINNIYGIDLNEIGKYWKDGGPNWFSLVTKSSSVWTVLYLIDLLYKGVNGNPQTTEAFAKTIGCSS